MAPSVLSEEGVDWFERGGDGFAAVMLALNTTLLFVICRARWGWLMAGGGLEQESRMFQS